MKAGDAGYQHPFFLDQRGERRFHGGSATAGEPHKDHPAITVADAPLYQGSVQQSAYTVGHCSGRDKGLLNQFPGGEFMRRFGPSQSRKDIKFPPLQIVYRVGLPARCVQTLRDPADATEDMKRGGIDVGKSAFPSVDKQVDVVGRCVRGCFHTIQYILTSRYFGG